MRFPAFIACSAILLSLRRFVACPGKKSLQDGLNARCDSFVVETDVHFPTDTYRLLDAVRKTIETCVDLSQANGLSEWRQNAYNIR